MNANNAAPPSPLTPASSAASNPPTIHTGRFTPLDPIKVIRQYAAFLSIIFIVGLIAGYALFLFLKWRSPQYSSEAQLLVTGSLVAPYDEPTLAGAPSMGRLDVLSAFIKNQIIFIKSDIVLSGAIKRPGVRATFWFRRLKKRAGRNGQALSARDDLQAHLKANHVLGSTLMRLSLRGPYKGDLDIILQAVISSYLHEFDKQNNNESTEVRRVFIEESRRARQDFENIHRQMKIFREENDLATLESQNDEANIGYNDLASQASLLSLRYQSAREAYRSLLDARKTGTLTIGPNELAEVEADPAVALRDERLRGLREQREVLMHRMGKGHRVVVDLGRTIVATEAERAREVKRLLREKQAVQLDQGKILVVSLKGQLDSMGPALEEARARVRDLTEKLAEYAQIQELANAASERRARAEKLLQSMALRRERPDNAGVKLLISPTKAKLTFPTMSGVMLSTVVIMEVIMIGLIFAKELLDQRIKSPSDVMLIPHAKILGMVPATIEDPIGPKDVENVVVKDPTGLMAESYRQVRSSILGVAERDNLKAIMLVGPQPASGVSATLNNLALSLAFDGRKVLVVDANFRKPSLQRIFGVHSEQGLVEILKGESTLDENVVSHIETGVDVLTAGDYLSSNPELLECRLFHNLLAEIKSRYDIILFDTPPALLSAEALILVKQVDASIVVVRASRDKRGMVGRMIRMLSNQRAVPLGIVLNAVRASAGGYFSKNFKAFNQYRQQQQRDWHTEYGTSAGNKKVG